MEKVSIVIPTRNRGHLLQFALKSAVEQSYENIEIVVCDNYSIDNTRAVVESFNDQRIIYVRTESDLSMPDNWEYALHKATGKYITYLTDDSYLFQDSVRIALVELNQFNAQVAAWRHCSYFSSDWLEPGRRNVAYMPRVTGKTDIFNSRSGLQNLYNNMQTYLIPKSLNSICDRSVIDKALSIQGRFFLHTVPDYTSCVSMLMNVEEYLFIDKPLFIDGVTTASIGATTSFNGPSFKKFLNEYQRESNDLSFLGLPTSIAIIATSLETVRQFYTGVCPVINRRNMLCQIVDSLTKVGTNGVNLQKQWQTLNDFITTQTLGIKLAIAKQKVLSKLKWMIVKVIRGSKSLAYLETVRNIRILKGNKLGFDNIETCAKKIVQILGQRNSESKSSS